MRTGLIGTKIGMTSIFSDIGEYTAVTLVEVKDCQVVDIKRSSERGYNAVLLGIGSVKQKNVSKPLKGYFAKQKVEPKSKLKEFLVSEDCLLNVGDTMCVTHFVPGQVVDVSARSIGKGFAGVMKRHNFSGLRASHGVSISHRSHGSTGQCQDPGKVFKGKKMAGQMGNKRVTVQNLQVVKVFPEDNLIAIKGAIPGSKGGMVELKDSVKKIIKLDLPLPAALKVNGADSKKAVEDVVSKKTETKSE